MFFLTYHGCFLVLTAPVLVVLVDFKAIYPDVHPGIFASLPGVAHFSSFEQICQYRGENLSLMSFNTGGKFISGACCLR
jgi:hypothetical protein